MKSKKQDYHLQAKRKAYQEVNHVAGSGTDVTTSVTAQAQPEEAAKEAVAVKVVNKGQNVKVDEAEATPAETAEPEAVATATN